MSGSPSCTKCRNPLAVASATGLCPACAPAAEPATASFVPPAPAGEPNTITFPGVAPSAPDTPNNAADPTPASAAAPDPHAPTHTAPDAEATLSGPGAPLAKAEKPLPPDPAGYTLLARLGRGGMGEVFRAHEHSTDQFVALKMIDPERIGDTSFERFRREYRALANFKHPHAVRGLKDRFDHDPPFFTMELVPGCTVAERLETVERFDPTEAVKLIRKVALAVQALHDHTEFGHPSAGAIHRDIKPHNILLTADGEPKLADFGLVKYLDAATLTATDRALGTPAYMPPEQCAGRHAEMCYASDVYGLGATLYHMLTGELPFRGTLPQIVAQVLTVDPPPVRAVAPDVPEKLSDIVRSCMHKYPRDRYRTVNALIAALDAWLAGLNPPLPGPTLATRVWRWAGRNAVALCALLALGGAAVAAWPREAPDPLKAMQSELDTGREVVLIPSAGKPRWHRWVLGAPELTASTSGDGSCSFEANGYSLLELCPDPMTDRYRLRAKVRFTEIKLRDEPVGRTVGTTSAGIYFGRSTAGGNNGLLVHALFAVTFSDELRPQPVPVPGAPPPKPPENTVRFRGMLVHQRPDAAPSAGPLGGPWGVIDRPAKLPGPWRALEIEVTPERVRARCEGPDGKPGEFADLTGAAVSAFHADLRRKLDADAPNHGAVLPEWTARAPLGIWNLRSTIDVKDVTLTPLP